MGLTQQKKRTIAVFLCIYLVLAALLAWIGLFNSGLEIIEKPSTLGAGKNIFFKNNSHRIINNIAISAIDESGQKTLLMNIPRAAPQQEIEIEPSKLQEISQALIVSEAFFYSSFSKPFTQGIGKRGLTYSLRLPSIIFLENQFSFEIETCNSLAKERNISLQTIVAQEFFKEQIPQKQITVPPNGCKTEQFSLTAQKTGQTTIIFNIEVENSTEQIPKTLEIVQ